MNQDCQRNAEKKFSGLKVPETISRETANLFWFPQVVFYDALFLRCESRERSQNRLLERISSSGHLRDCTSYFSGDPSALIEPLGEEQGVSLALHGGNKNVHHPCARLKESRQVDASILCNSILHRCLKHYGWW